MHEEALWTAHSEESPLLRRGIFRCIRRTSERGPLRRFAILVFLLTSNGQNDIMGM
jgi:hypothetical protein